MHDIQTAIKCTIIAVLVITILQVQNTSAQIPEDIQLSGYIQAMPIWVRADLPDPIGERSFWEFRVQQRLNIQWYIDQHWTFNWQMRTRLFTGELVEDLPGYADLIDRDDGFVNMSWMIAEEDKWLLHYMPDRLNVDWSTAEWSVRAGRQRINWGINLVTNPNDLFNIYSFYDFDYPERPGTDAIRIQRFTSPLSKWDFAFSPARDFDQSVVAGMYAFNTRGYDIQIIGGYFRNRIAMGGGWAGSIHQTGFKGEVMLFTDIESSEGDRDTDFVLAVSADHMFANGIFVVVEGVYNQRGGQDEFVLTLDEPLSADNPTFSRYQFTVQASYSFSPVWYATAATLWYPDEDAVFIYPTITYSVLQDLDLSIFTQVFIAASDSIFSTAGNVVATSLKWNF